MGLARSKGQMIACGAREEGPSCRPGAGQGLGSCKEENEMTV